MDFRGENRILLYLKIFTHRLYAGRELQGAWHITEMIYPPNISSFVDEKNLQIVKKFSSILLNTQLKALKHDGYLSTFRNDILALLLQYNEAIKGLSEEEKMITVALLQAADVFGISSDTLKALVEKVKEKHKRMNKVSM